MTYGAGGAGGFGGNHVALGSGVALASTFSGTVGVNTTYGGNLKFITGSGTAIVNGDSCLLESVAGGGKIPFSADF